MPGKVMAANIVLLVVNLSHVTVLFHHNVYTLSDKAKQIIREGTLLLLYEMV